MLASCIFKLTLTSLVVSLAYSCFTPPIATSGSGTSSSVSGSSSPSQYKLPPVPAASKKSTCGHNQYYHGTNSPGSGIVGGIEAASNEYPWLARLQIDQDDGTSNLCGATLIDYQWLITAAHCVEGQSPSSIIAVFGDHNKTITENGIKYSMTISKIVINGNYNSQTHDYDIAILKLSSAVSTTSDWYSQMICLPANSSDGCNAGTTAYIAGWGTTSEGSETASSKLQKAYLPIQSLSKCQAAYASASNQVTNNMICAGYDNGGVDTCLGDSGGPLMTVSTGGYYQLCGITSWGLGCARSGYYGVYANVGLFLDWIASVKQNN